MSLARLRHALVLAALVVLALSVTGCAGGAGWGATLAILTSLSMLFAAGCGQAHRPDEDAAIADAGADTSVAPFDAGDGTWESCCEGGRIDTCFCPASWACNYGWYTDCGGGTCAFTPEECPAMDAGTPDAGGDWEPCCVDGVVDSCFCPGGAECNYGWYTDCGGGTCAFSPEECPAVDAGAPDAGGYWEPCCVDGVIDSCFCPAGLACNYGWFTDCGDGLCVGPTDSCPAAPTP